MICPKCQTENLDGTRFCVKCGAPLNNDTQQTPPMGSDHNANAQMNQGIPQGNPNMQGNPQMNNGMPYQQTVYIDPKDHTAEFDPRDISDNKIIAMLPYLLGIVGIILALLAANQSPYTHFHVREQIKITILTTILGIFSGVLVWTFIVPFAAGVCVIILYIIRIICFFSVCSGKAKEAPIVSSFDFLK